MRFQDAARDARAVVYAGIQADPLVARAAALLADASLAQRVLARAVMNGETIDPDGWRATFPTLFAPSGRSTRRERERSEAILDSLTGRGQSRRAGPQPGPRGAGRGADGAAPRPAGGRRRRSTRAARPVRRGPGRDPPVRRDGRACRGRRGYDCKWGARGINADVLHQLDDARTFAVDEGERLAVALVVFDAQRSCQVRLDRQTAPHGETGVVTLETLDELAAPG